MTPERDIIHLDLHRTTVTPLQMDIEREAWAKQQRRREVWGNIFAGTIASLALCGLLLLVISLGWLS